MSSLRKLRKYAVAVLLSLAACASSYDTVSLGARLIERGYVADVHFDEAQRSLRWMWNHTDDHEWALCLEGNMVGDTLNIHSVRMADIFDSSPHSVVASCRITPDFVGFLHPHRNGNCALSNRDMSSYLDGEDVAFFGVMCGEYRIFLPTYKVMIGDSVRASAPPVDFGG